MPPLWSSKKTDVALSVTTISLETVKGVADLIPTDFVGPILEVVLQIIKMVEVCLGIRLPLARIINSLWLSLRVAGCENEQGNLFRVARRS